MEELLSSIAPTTPGTAQPSLRRWSSRARAGQTAAAAAAAKSERTTRRGLNAGRRKVIVGVTILALMLIGAFLCPTPYVVNEADPSAALLPPNGSHWLGTDSLGRDVLSRVMVATRVDLPLAVGATAIAIVVGVGLGLLASTKRFTSEVIMRCLDIFEALPIFVLMIVAVTLAGNSIPILLLAMGAASVPTFVRLVRSESLALRESRFIEAATAIGATRRDILLKHMLPNITTIVSVNAAVVASSAIVALAGLSFLGVGVQPPTPSWGQMIQLGAGDLTSGVWWVVAFPGIAVLVCGVVFNQIAMGLDQMFGRGTRG